MTEPTTPVQFKGESVRDRIEAAITLDAAILDEIDAAFMERDRMGKACRDILEAVDLSMKEKAAHCDARGSENPAQKILDTLRASVERAIVEAVPAHVKWRPRLRKWT